MRRRHGSETKRWPEEVRFYTAPFGVGLAIGVLANITWDKGLGYAIERPKSITTDMLERAGGIR